MSLSINDLVLLDVDEEDINWDSQPSQEAFGTQLYRVQKMSVSPEITLRHHTVSITDTKAGLVRLTSPKTWNFIKVKIDPIGRLTPSND